MKANVTCPDGTVIEPAFSPKEWIRDALAYRDAVIAALPADPDIDDEIDRALREAKGPRVMKRLVTLSALALALLCSACSMSQVERHTTAAGIMHQVAESSAHAIDAGAQRAADDAIRPCVEGGAPRATCETVLTESMRRWRIVAAAQGLYASSVDAYVTAVLVAAAEDDPDWGDALRLLGAALDVYREAAALAAEYGVDMPALTRVMSVIGGDL